MTGDDADPLLVTSRLPPTVSWWPLVALIETSPDPGESRLSRVASRANVMSAELASAWMVPLARP